ncbi:hypothetical protein ACJZ2D_001173 [Fusarium nematophilum]
MATSNYTIELPLSAVIVTTWDEFHTEGRKYPNSAVVPKYGGFVIEVDEEIKMATDEKMTQEVAEKLASLSLRDDGEAADGVEESPEGGPSLEKRRCSHPGSNGVGASDEGSGAAPSRHLAITTTTTRTFGDAAGS